jgi:hypothetical protein
MTESRKVCCSSPAAMFYWAIVSLIAWCALSLIGIFWHPLHASSAVTCLLAPGIGCVANWMRNRSLHCVITAPIFLIAAAVFLLSDMGWIHVKISVVWAFVCLGVGIAFFLEGRYTRPRVR